MPLKIRVKPEGTVMLGNALVRNGGKRPCELVILNDVPVLREKFLKDTMASEQVDAEQKEAWRKALPLMT